MLNYINHHIIMGLNILYFFWSKLHRLLSPVHMLQLPKHTNKKWIKYFNTWYCYKACKKKQKNFFNFSSPKLLDYNIKFHGNIYLKKVNENVFKTLRLNKVLYRSWNFPIRNDKSKFKITKEINVLYIVWWQLPWELSQVMQVYEGGSWCTMYYCSWCYKSGAMMKFTVSSCHSTKRCQFLIPVFRIVYLVKQVPYLPSCKSHYLRF